MNPIADALDALFPKGGVVELRALADRFTHSGYFDDFAKLTAAAEALDADPEVKGIYVTLNVVDPALLARRANRVKMRLTRSDPTTADADINRRRWLPIDLDPVRPSGVSSTDEEHAAAIERADAIARWLSEQGFPDPVKADSGNGAHLLYAIDLPNDDEATALVKGVLATLDLVFSNDSVVVDTANFNAARIWELYGTLSRKGDHTPDRPHRRAKILAVPEHAEIVTADLLRAIATPLPVDAPAPPKGKKAPVDLGAWLSAHGIGVRSTRPWQGGTLYVLEDCPFSDAHRDGAFAIQFPSGAIYAGCHHTSCGGGAQRWPELRGMHEQKIGNKPQKRTPPAPAPEPDAFRERAMEVLTRGDPLAFILDTFHREHVGDHTVAECLVLSIASQSVENTHGLHVAISGISGKGKTHTCETMLDLIPKAFQITGTVSDKALYYHDDLRPGSVFLFDDVSLSDDMQELLKNATTRFREPIEHRTLTSDRRLRICTIPERCVWWLAKVKSVGDDQVMNRMLTVWIDDSNHQDLEVLGHMKEAEAQRRRDREQDEDVHVCRAIWEILKERTVYVRIPFATRISFQSARNRRNPAMLFDLIKASALLKSYQREQDEDGSLIATREDFDTARRVFLAINRDAGGQETKQTRNEAAALETIAAMGLEIFTIRQLQDALGLSYNKTYRLLHGYCNSKATYTGILDKCPAVSPIDATVAEERYGVEMRRREHYFSFDYRIYREWTAKADVWIDDDPDVSTFAPGFHPPGENVTAAEESRS
ncbi:hypothetical protein [Methanofollis formosanus]|uniref:hypothetical protein n=1 Tax=Methanofollis formosanus TaxID=299308 RepID=UPI003CCEA1A4